MKRRFRSKATGLIFLLAGVFAVGFGSCKDNAATPVVAYPLPAPSESVQPGQSPCRPLFVEIDIPPNAALLGADAFGVNPLIVAVGASVTWINYDTADHTVTPSDGTFGSIVMAPGDTYEHGFETEGTFPYYCAIHGQGAMSGTVKVMPQPPGCAGA